MIFFFIPIFFYILIQNLSHLSLQYSDVLKNGLDCPVVLQDSDFFDVILCSLVSDIDFDGNNEILLGTYGQQILAYKLSGYSNGKCQKRK